MSDTRIKAPRELVVVVTSEAAHPPSGEALDMLLPPSLSSISELIKQRGASIRPLFGLSPARIKAKLLTMPSVSSVNMNTLSKYFAVDAPDDQLEAISAQIRGHAGLQAVFLKPSPEPATFLNTMLPTAVEPPAQTPDFTARQLYLSTAPGGVDAEYAWTVPGGSGDGVSIIDIEGEWRFSHEDLIDNEGGVVGGTPPGDLGWRNHGTAVLGEFHGDRNAFGVTGICPGANVRGISVFNDGAAAAIRAAADMLGAGDIILIELHYPGPRFNFDSPNGQQGYIPAEWWPDNYDAIRYATDKGILVVEAAGNGSENLDDPLYDTNPAPPNGPFPNNWSNPFRRTLLDSGAILVGAGAPPSGTHGHDWGPDRSRLDFSNYGSMVDVQGWGREVTTCGYGDLQGGSNEDLWYTDTFSGTSSATPIVVGVLGCLQGALREAGKALLTPASARALLRSGGSSQQDGLAGPSTERIGNRPDLRELLQTLAISAPNVANVPATSPIRTITLNFSTTSTPHAINLNFGSTSTE